MGVYDRTVWKTLDCCKMKLILVTAVVLVAMVFHGSAMPSEERDILRETLMELLHQRRSCTDSESSSYCESVVRKNNCNITKYRMKCRQKCGNCGGCYDKESSTYCQSVKKNNRCNVSKSRSKCRKTCGSC